MSIEGKQDTMLLMGTIRSTGECITIQAEMNSLPQVLESIERFLRGCGFCFEGELDIIPPEKL